MNRILSGPRAADRRLASSRRGFNLVEMLLALTISAVLLAATLVALNASFMAYQTTTEVASTHTISRLTMHRVLSLIRTGREFGPFPADPHDTVVRSDFIEFRNPDGDIMSLEWVPARETLEIVMIDSSDGTTELMREELLKGVVAQTDSDGNPVSPFTLEYRLGRKLFRATVDLMIVPDDNMSVTLDGDSSQIIRLVASAMPRTETY